MNKRVLLLSLLVVSCFSLPALAVDFPEFPMSFWGNVTVNGSNAPVGAVVRAYYGSTLAGEVTLTEAGVYGYTEPTLQKLVVGEGVGAITFKIQASSVNSGNETAGTVAQTYSGFTSGLTVNKNLAFNVSTGSSGGSSSGGGGGAVTKTPTPTPAVSGTPAPATGLGGTGNPANLAKHGFHEGQVVSAAGSSDPDVYIVNAWGYKRLFLNPIIFGFYGHLGGWKVVTPTNSVARDDFVTSGIFKNCETNDEKVYAVEVTGEDTGTLHHIQMTGAQVVAEDPDFFHRVFCINTNEFNWYSKSSVPYTSLSQIPYYTRK